METNKAGSKKYWLSLDQWRNDPEFVKMAEEEFMSNPLADDGEPGWARREFLKLMGASMALTSFGCLRRPAQKIVPYVKRPMDVVPGLANYYASSYIDGTEGFGIVVTTREGRPIKIEGNPAHPYNEGGMSARAHAHILSLYDPDRLTEPKENLLNKMKTNRDTVSTLYETADKEIVAALKKGKVALLTGSVLSPSTRRLIDDFKSAFGAKTYTWDAFDNQPRLSLDKAQLILSVDADILGTFGATTRHQIDFAKGRKPDATMNRLVVFESLLSLTGTNADDRYRIRPSQQLDVVMGLLHKIVVEKGRSSYASNTSAKELLDPYANVAGQLAIDAHKFDALAEELWQKRSSAVVVAGGFQGQTVEAKKLQMAVRWLNEILGNSGYETSTSQLAGVRRLVEDLNSGAVKTLIIHGVNPLYGLPKDLGLFAALQDEEGTKKEDKKLVVYTGDRIDETGAISNFILPDDHPLEKWGDAEFIPGVYSIQQPTIRPLYKTRAFEDSLISWMKAASRGGSRVSGSESWFDYLQAHWKDVIYAQNRSKASASSFSDFWVDVLQTGVFDTQKSESSRAKSVSLNDLKGAKPTSTKGYELTLYATVGLKDGSLANVPWLQEFPDPVTKICWDNYLCVSPADAHREDLAEGQVVKVSVGENSVQVPVHIQPGQADGVLGLAIGYGRKGAGKVADGVGVNAWKLATANGDSLITSGLAVKVEKTPKFIPLANVQGHHSMEGRQIVVEQTVAQYMRNPQANMHKHKIFSMYQPHKYDGHKWGMVIDLNVCNGCSSCIIACQSENNIPVVGKKYVLQGREMHWLRVDRYYVGEPENPATVYQPLPCQHCDNAPCEAVCPVAATVHSDEGTNDMIYNRCVGTRYCSNNCPYKVRRFNWFDYVKTVRKPQNYAMNPEVTVRARGVMEKCTFCVHKIKTEKMIAKTEKRELKDGDVKTACQMSCPTGAILFGDLNNPDSAVAKEFHKKDTNTYSLLEEWGTFPAVKYKTVIRNTEELKGGGGHGHGNDHGKGGHA